MDFPHDESAPKVVKLPVRPKPAAEAPLQTVHTYGKCRHLHTLVDERAAEVTCADCGEKLNPIWVLTQLATEDRILRDRWAAMRAEVRLLGERTRVKCRHCSQFTPIPTRARSEDLRALAERIKREEGV